MSHCAGGRVGERAATALADQLKALDLPLARLKTGTPPRLDGRTIDWAVLERQPSDDDDWTMSSMGEGRVASQPFCAIIRTRSEEHTSELQSLMRISYAVFCLKKTKTPNSRN